MNPARLSFWQAWLLHATGLWLGCTLLDAGAYWYRQVERLSLHSLTAYEARFWHHNYTQASEVLLLTAAGVVEATYTFGFQRFRWPLFLVLLLVASSGWAAGAQMFNHWKFGLPGQPFSPTLLLGLTSYGVLYTLGRDAHAHRRQAAALRHQHQQAELAVLRGQLHPHFLFNALNSLYGTALCEQASQTADSLEQLANLLRYSLQQAQQPWISVAEEFQFLTAYLHLQRQRLPAPPALHLHTHLHYDDLPARIAPLLLLPLLENAFQHGVSTERPCAISCHLVVAQQQLHLVVENDLLPARAPSLGTGTGLANVRRRLHLLYPHRHSLRIHTTPARYQVRLHVHLAVDSKAS